MRTVLLCLVGLAGLAAGAAPTLDNPGGNGVKVPGSTYSSLYGVDIRRVGDYVYCLGHTGGSSGVAVMWAFDTSENYQGLLEISSLNAGGFDVDSTNKYAYATTQSGLYVLDISDPTSITLVTTVATGNYYKVLVDGNSLYVSMGDGTMCFYDITTPASPSLITTTAVPVSGALPTQMAVSGNYLYAACGKQAVCYYDITTHVGAYIAHSANYFYAAAIKDTYLYIGERATGIYVYDISSGVPSGPSGSDAATVSGSAIQFRAYYDHLYVCTYIYSGSFRFQVWDVSTPSLPVFLNEQVGSDFYQALDVYGDKGYVVGWQGTWFLSGVDNSWPATSAPVYKESAGCYRDSMDARVFSENIYWGPDNTIESCVQQCYDAGFTLAGVQFGTQCWCGNSGDIDTVTRLKEETCDMACSGDSTELCGGSWAMHVYSMVPLPSEPASTYVGCYKDDSSRVLHYLAYFDASNTVEKCSEICYYNEYEYAGLEYGFQCWCGHSISTAVSVPEYECIKSCPGNSAQTCGGNWRISIWATNV